MMTNITEELHRLQYLLEVLPGPLSRIPEAVFGQRPAEGKWSPKEILGHLVDSASNNYQRLIRAQYENVPRIVYDQEQWVRFNHYQDMDSSLLIALWTGYNRHLLDVAGRITPGNLLRSCHTGGPEPVSLSWLIHDYVRHLEHHLQQITDY